MESRDSQKRMSVKRLFNGTELANGDVFINARPSGEPGYVTVRLFVGDVIVTRRWREHAMVVLAD